MTVVLVQREQRKEADPQQRWIVLKNSKSKSSSEAAESPVAESPNRAPPRPASEQASRHSRKSAEASRGVLTKSSSKGAPLTTPPSGDNSGGSGGGSASSADDKTDGSGVGDYMKVTRATCRFRLKFNDLDGRVDPKLGEKRPPDPRRAILYQARDRVVRGANLLNRMLWRIDGDKLDVFQLAHGRLPNTQAEWRQTWPIPKVKGGTFNGRPLKGAYGVICQAVPELSPGIASAVARSVERKWKKERFEALVRNKRTPAHYKETYPIPVRAADAVFRLEKNRFILSCPFERDEKHEGKRQVFDFQLKDKFHRTVMENIISEQWKKGEVKFEQDSKRPMVWFIRVSYSRLVPRAKEGITAGINRGIRFFVCARTSNGDEWILDGNGIEAHLQAIKNRRRSFQREAKASKRAGRGRKRILQPIEPLMAKGQRWRQTRCQVIARRLALWMKDHHVNKVVIEDFSGIRRNEPKIIGERNWKRVQEWPYYQLQSRLEACLTEYGITVIVVKPKYISLTCPQCGNISQQARNLKQWRYKCKECGYNRHLDITAAHNVMNRGLVEEGKEPVNPGKKKASRAGVSKPMSGKKSDKIGKKKGAKKGTSRKTQRKPQK